MNILGLFYLSFSYYKIYFFFHFVLGLNAFGSDPYLRYQLRSAIRDIRNDDQSILWEGPESLSTEELKAACEERGMRASGLSRDEYLTQLQHWLDMSVSKSKAKGARMDVVSIFIPPFAFKPGPLPSPRSLCI